MKHLYTCVCLFLIACSFSAPVKASHLLGGELYYKYESTANGNETYRVTLKLFADCASSSNNAAYADLPFATPTIRIYKDGALVNAINLQIEPYPASDFEITPVCPSQRDSTKCKNINNPLPGVKRFIYSGLVTLNGTAANWRFTFTGELSTASSAGRSMTINNLANLTSSLITLEATLNNQGGPNSSPSFTSEPTPFFCINKAQEYNLGAIDPDGDNLTVSLVSALESSFANCTYIPPYTPTQPIAAQTGTFVFNPATGQLSFLPNQVMNGVVVNRVDEFRNGVKIGSSMREMTFVIIQQCNNDAPKPGFITDLNGGFNSGLNEITTCQGQTSNLKFSFNTTDPNGDTIVLSYNGLPPGASVTIDNNNTLSPTLHFDWDISTTATGVYTFFVTLTDKGCPLASQQTLSYTIKIEPLMNAFDTGFTVGCKYGNNSTAWVHTKTADTALYTITWWDSSATELQSRTVTEGDTLSNVSPGPYRVLIRNSRGCVADIVIDIPEPPYKISFTSDSIICQNDEMSFVNTSTNDFTGWAWDFGDGSTSVQKDPSYTYPEAGTYIVRLIGTTDFPCEDTGYATVRVDSTPRVFFEIDNGRICEGEKIIFNPRFTMNADSIIWAFGDNRTLYYPADPNPVSYIYDASGSFEVALTAYYPFCPDSTYKETIQVAPQPVVNLRPDTTICPNSEPVQLSNISDPGVSVSYLWSTGESGPDILVYEPGVYSLTATSDAKCTTTDSVSVLRSCYLEIPNVFTPNGDGLNDHFFPRQLLSMRLTSFHMQVFNRWGVKVFETRQTDGRGWDGRFNDKIQPAGVYVYMIKAEIDNRIEETHNGNVTLIR